MKDINLLNGDCLEEMFKIENGSVDLILTSPPYDVGKNYNESVDLFRFIDVASKKLKKDGVFVWQVGNRVKDGIITPIDVLTHNKFIENGMEMINRVVWRFGHGLHCKKRFSHRYEVICIYVKSKEYTFNLDDVRIPSKYPNKKHYKGPKKGQLSGNPLGKNPEDVWDITNIKHNHPEKLDHPCQFPTALCDRVIKAFTNKGDIVMDPFMGVGTTGYVSVSNNRRFIGIELDKTFFDIASKRIYVE